MIWGIRLRLMIVVAVFAGLLAWGISFALVVGQNPNAPDEPFYGNQPSLVSPAGQ
jgi:hypothetical protein